MVSRMMMKMHISEPYGSGPPKKGPVTVIRVIRVGKTKSLMQIQSSKWHPIFGSRETEELSKRRLKEILSLISNAGG